MFFCIFSRNQTDFTLRRGPPAGGSGIVPTVWYERFTFWSADVLGGQAVTPVPWSVRTWPCVQLLCRWRESRPRAPSFSSATKGKKKRRKKKAKSWDWAAVTRSSNRMSRQRNYTCTGSAPRPGLSLTLCDSLERKKLSSLGIYQVFKLVLWSDWNIKAN